MQRGVRMRRPCTAFEVLKTVTVNRRRSIATNRRLRTHEDRLVIDFADAAIDIRKVAGGLTTAASR